MQQPHDSPAELELAAKIWTRRDEASAVQTTKAPWCWCPEARQVAAAHPALGFALGFPAPTGMEHSLAVVEPFLGEEGIYASPQ